MSILIKIAQATSVAFGLVTIIWGTTQVTEARAENIFQAEIIYLAKQVEQVEINQMIADMQAQLEAETKLLARAFYGEYREGTAADRNLAWEMKFSAIYNRLQYQKDWSGDFTETMLWGCDKGICEINALSVVGDDELLTNIGQEALVKADELINALHYGPFEPLHAGHSWATPAAVIGNSYFAGKCEVAKGPGHLYFADCTTGA